MPFVVATSPPRQSSAPTTARENTSGTPHRPPLASINPLTSVSRRIESTPSKMSASKAAIDEEEEAGLRFPTAMIDAESIGDVMAARLTTCLLGHVLFLKSQIPFPVMQMIKMASSSKMDVQPNKKRDALLSSFDLLSSHLVSTFTAVSAALSPISTGPSHAMKIATTHIAIVLGPSATTVNAARARIMLELQGLSVADGVLLITQIPPSASMNGHLKENEGVFWVKNAIELAGPLSERSRVMNEKTKLMALKENSEESKGVRNTMETCSPLGERSRILGDKLRRVPLVENTDESSDEELIGDGSVENVPDSESDSDSGSDIDSEEEEDSFEGEPEPESRQETEANFSAAERLLSRTLAVANADPQQGMAAEIRPTQIHILLRAPRRFSHPAWIPRQNLSRDMDPLLREFEPSAVTAASTCSDTQTDTLSDITNKSQPSGKPPVKVNAMRKGPGGIKTDYVRVHCKPAANKPGQANEESIFDGEHGHADTTGSDEEDGDEMIWWSWDGKLEGFTDW